MLRMSRTSIWARVVCRLPSSISVARNAASEAWRSLTHAVNYGSYFRDRPYTTIACYVQSQILLLLGTQGCYKYWAGRSETLGSSTVLNQVQTSRFVSGDISNLSEVSALCSTQVPTSITNSS